MKSKKRLTSAALVLIIILNCFLLSVVQSFAHSKMLDVSYDDCIYYNHADGIGEMWYTLVQGGVCAHHNYESTTIKYYFAETSKNGAYSWTTDVSEDVANEIKSAYAESMKKWNNVYFYTEVSPGLILKHKLINIVEGTATDYNIIVYPMTGNREFIALTYTHGSGDEVESGDVEHKHYSEWEMHVNVDYFYENEVCSAGNATLTRERNGAHEFGHVLGLRDIDSNNLCNAGASQQHHQELLMGYGAPFSERSFNITYKDIAGAAITRGLHTDYDHQWLSMGAQSDGQYKLVCSVCNGVKNVGTLEDISYDVYGVCNNNHTLAGGNMMPVASYGNKDYFKCKYCRYVAPFSDIVPQNYTKTYLTDGMHEVINNVQGLEYSFYESHEIVNNECVGCGTHIHSYTVRHQWYTDTMHKSYCSCGEYTMNNHVVASGSFSSGGMGLCIECRGRVFMGVLESVPDSNRLHTKNGSFILTNGIIVLVEEDMEAYLKGELVFYRGETE